MQTLKFIAKGPRRWSVKLKKCSEWPSRPTVALEGPLLASKARCWPPKPTVDLGGPSWPQRPFLASEALLGLGGHFLALEALSWPWRPILGLGGPFLALEAHSWPWRPVLGLGCWDTKNAKMLAACSWPSRPFLGFQGPWPRMLRCQEGQESACGPFLAFKGFSWLSRPRMPRCQKGKKGGPFLAFEAPSWPLRPLLGLRGPFLAFEAPS